MMKLRLTFQFAPVYLHAQSKTLLAVTAAFFIVLYHQYKPVSVLLMQWNTWLALLFSYLLCYWTITGVCYINEKLGDIPMLRKNGVSRLAAQFVCCYLFPLFAVYVLVRLYFFVLPNGCFHCSGYMEKEFVEVRWMIFSLNCLLLPLDGRRSIIENRKTTDYFFDDKLHNTVLAQLEHRIKEPDIKVKFGDQETKVAVNRIAAYSKVENVGVFFLKDKEQVPAEYGVAEVVELIGSRHVAQINRWTVVAFDAIQDYRKNRTMVLENDINEAIEKAFSTKESKEAQRYITVSRLFRDDFDLAVKAYSGWCTQ